jgi:hypothetical protein
MEKILLDFVNWLEGKDCEYAICKLSMFSAIEEWLPSCDAEDVVKEYLAQRKR